MLVLSLQGSLLASVAETAPTECKFERQINERVKSVVEVSDLVVRTNLCGHEKEKKKKKREKKKRKKNNRVRFIHS